MYESLYQLHTDPFRLAPDPKFCFEHQHFRKGRAYMKYALSQGDGILMITGHPGTGKTMLVEHFLRELDRSTLLTATLLNTQVEQDDLFRMVGFGFGINVRNLDRATILQDLQEFLVTKRRSGHRALLIVDEAQDLSRSALEQLRMLTNLREKSHPLLQLFLVGQKQLIEMVHTPEMEPLYQRLIAASHLEPLGLEETIAYMQHRLRCAGWRDDPHFTRAARVLIYRFSGGYPRLINKICGRVLLYGSVEQKHRLDTEDVFKALDQVQDECLMPGNEIQGYGITADIKEIMRNQSDNSDWSVHLTIEERTFIEQPETATQPETISETVTGHNDTPAPVEPEPLKVVSEPENTPPEPATHNDDPPASVAISAVQDSDNRVSVSAEPEHHYMPGQTPVMAAGINPWFGIAASIILALSLFMMLGGSKDHSSDATPNDELIAFVAETSQENVTASDNSAVAPAADPEHREIAQPVATSSHITDPSHVLPQVALLSVQTGDTAFATVSNQTDSDLPAPENGVSESSTREMGVTVNAAELNNKLQDTTDSTSSSQEIPPSNPAPGLAAIPQLETAVTDSAADPATGISTPPDSEAPVDVDSVTSEEILVSSTSEGPVETSTEDSVQRKAENEIRRLLLLAKHAYQQDRLTTPRDKSAFRYLQQVLNRDPDNLPAKYGMYQLVERYDVLAEGALERQEYAKVQTLTVRGLGIDSSNRELLTLQAKARLLAEEAALQQQSNLISPKLADISSNEEGSEGILGKLKTFFTDLTPDEVSVNDFESAESY